MKLIEYCASDKDTTTEQGRHTYLIFEKFSKLYNDIREIIRCKNYTSPKKELQTSIENALE